MIWYLVELYQSNPIYVLILNLYFQISSYIKCCQKETRGQERKQRYIRNLSLVSKEMEQLSRQASHLREELRGLEGRMEGISSTIKQMILNEQLVTLVFNLSVIFILYLFKIQNSPFV